MGKNGVTDERLRWPNRTVPYVFSQMFGTSVYSVDYTHLHKEIESRILTTKTRFCSELERPENAPYKAIIFNAMMEGFKQTCIRFVPAELTHPDYVVFTGGMREWVSNFRSIWIWSKYALVGHTFFELPLWLFYSTKNRSHNLSSFYSKKPGFFLLWVNGVNKTQFPLNYLWIWKGGRRKVKSIRSSGVPYIWSSLERSLFLIHPTFTSAKSLYLSVSNTVIIGASQ